MATEARNPERVITWYESPGLYERARRAALRRSRQLATRFGGRLQVIRPNRGLLGPIGLAVPSGMRRELAVITLDPAELRSKELSAWKRLLIESSTCPVMVLPIGQMRRGSVFRSILVPMSGERKANSALSWAIREGNLRGVPVDVMHVTHESEAMPGTACATIAQARDQAHHEYAHLVDEFLSAGSPLSSVADRRVIRSFRHCGGDPAEQILSTIPAGWSGLLALEWKGQLQPGRGRTIKRILQRRRIPIVLVRHQERGETRLKVGAEFREGA